MSDITIFADGQCISVDGLNKGKLNVPGMKTHLDTIINDDPPPKKKTKTMNFHILKAILCNTLKY